MYSCLLKILLAVVVGLLPVSLRAQTGVLQPSVPMQILQQHRVKHGSHAITYNRVAPPVFPVQSVVQVHPTPQPTQSGAQPDPQKSFEFIMLGGTVYDHQFTDLRWFNGDQWLRVISNIDFNYFSGMSKNRIFTTLGVLGCLIFGSCTKKREEGRSTTQQGSQENLSREDVRPNLHSTEVSGTARLGEVDLLLVDADTARKELLKLTSQRTPQAAQSMILYLKKQEGRFPETLPSFEVLKELEAHHPPTDHWIYCYNQMLSCVRYLVLTDLPETKRAVSELMERMKAKYGNSESGKVLIEGLEKERLQSMQDLKQGITPWKTGVSNTEGID